MSDDDGNKNLTPLSSNSSGSSGTRAWGVSVAEDPEKAQPDETVSTAREQSESFSAPKAAPMTDKEAREPVAETVDLPVTENESPESEATESFAANAEQTSEDEFTSNGSSETDSQAEPDLPEFDSSPETDEAETSADAVAASDEPVTETIVSDEPAPEPVAEEQTTEDLRKAVLDTMTEHEEQQEAFALFERMSGDFSAMMVTARNDAAAFSFKLIEFAQANAQNSFELARGYSHARSIPEIFNVQADYLKRQLELLNVQARELQALTAEVAAKNTMEIQGRHSAV